MLKFPTNLKFLTFLNLDSPESGRIPHNWTDSRCPPPDIAITQIQTQFRRNLFHFLYAPFQTQLRPTLKN
jgi:hypothetical protein